VADLWPPQGHKFYEYAQAGIAEYWLVEPEAGIVEVYVLDDGAYTLLVKAGPGESAYSRIIAGFQVASGALFDA
jgi:Uma2 family endonuclease